jgi:hypothetical protein
MGSIGFVFLRDERTKNSICPFIIYSYVHFGPLKNGFVLHNFYRPTAEEEIRNQILRLRSGQG